MGCRGKNDQTEKGVCSFGKIRKNAVTPQKMDKSGCAPYELVGTRVENTVVKVQPNSLK